MTSSPSHEQKAAFFMKLQRLLTEGQFVSTYKYALLLALTRWAVENPNHAESDPLDVSTLAPYFLELYWPQAQPFRSRNDDAVQAVAEADWNQPAWGLNALLIQERANQPTRVLRLILEAREAGHLQLHRLPEAFRERLLRAVRDCIRNEPLRALQRVGGEELPFLYRRGARASQIMIEPGIVGCLASFSPLIEHLVRSAWLQFVLRCNTGLLGSAAQVEEFLFPDGRNSLALWRPVLEAIQGPHCFYCRKTMSPKVVAVDHFLPWARYPRDLGDNFVLAHAACNSRKRDHLPSVEHLERWCSRNEDERERLNAAFEAARLPHDWPTVRRAASSLYHIVAESEGRVWQHESGLVALDGQWRSLLGVG